MFQLRTRENIDAKDKQPVAPEILAKMDGSTEIIKNVVFARDASIIDFTTGFANQRDAFCHENYLNVKALVRRNELAADDCSPSSPHARAFRLRANQQ